MKNKSPEPKIKNFKNVIKIRLFTAIVGRNIMTLSLVFFKSLVIKTDSDTMGMKTSDWY